jgi:hypothetical protein
VILDARHLDRIHAALAIDPNLEVMIRPEHVETIVAEFRAVARHPLIVQLERGVLRAGAPIVHSLGARVLTNVFDEDEVAAEGNREVYDAPARSGADILQGDRPELMLPHRGRAPGRLSMLLARHSGRRAEIAH